MSDRHAPLRAAAAAGLAAVHARADPVAVLKHLAAMPLGEAAATCRAVAQHAPAVEREFHAYVAAERRAAERAAAEAEAQYAAGRAHAISGLEPEEEGFSAEEEREESLSFSAEREASPPPAASEEASRRRAEEKALVEKARRLRDSQRREEEAARRSADEVAALEEERRAAEEDRIEAQEERRSAEKFSDGLDGLDGSDASVSVSDSVEIEHPPRAEDAEDEKRASPASSTRAKPLETESAAVRAYRESRAAADASVERRRRARDARGGGFRSAAKASPPSRRRRRRRRRPRRVRRRSRRRPRRSRKRSRPCATPPGTPRPARARARVNPPRPARRRAVTAEEARVVVAAATRALSRGESAARGEPEPSPSAETKTHALFTLRDLARCSPEAFAPHAPAALPAILDALEDPEGVERDPEVALGAGDAVGGVVDAIAPEAALRALAPRLRLTNAPVVSSLSEFGTVKKTNVSAAPVRCVGGVVARMSAASLRGVAPDILPGLVEAFNSTSADVRKAVVDALVAMYDALGDWLLPRLDGLTAAQHKLLTIYINRAAERRDKSGSVGKERVGGAGRVPLAPRLAQ